MIWMDINYLVQTNGKGGGVAVYINENINFKRRQDLENPHIESLWIEILIKKLEVDSCWVFLSSPR